MGDRVWESMVELKSIGVGAKLALARPDMSGRSMTRSLRFAKELSRVRESAAPPGDFGEVPW